jgi:hypothetical protein
LPTESAPREDTGLLELGDHLGYDFLAVREAVGRVWVTREHYAPFREDFGPPIVPTRGKGRRCPSMGCSSCSISEAQGIENIGWAILAGMFLTALAVLLWAVKGHPSGKIVASAPSPE